MNETPKDPKAEESDSAGQPDPEAQADAPEDQQDLAEAEAADGEDVAGEEDPQNADASDAQAPESEPKDEPQDQGDMAVAATAAAAAAAGAVAAASAPAAREDANEEKSGGVSVVIYVWLAILTLGVGFLLYLLLGDAEQLTARLNLGDDPAIKSSMAAAAEASGKADANAAAIQAIEGAGSDAAAAAAKLAEAASADVQELRGVVESAGVAVETKLAEALSGIGGRIAALEGRPAAPAAPTDDGAASAALAAAEAAAAAAEANATATTANAAARAALAEKLAALETRLAALEQRAEKASGRSLAAAILALNDLRAGVASGKPFGKLLGRAQAALPESEPLKQASWTSFADGGLPTNDALLAQMQGLSVAIGQDKLKDRVSTGESWFDQAVGGVIDRLKVRRVGAGVEGAEPAAVAARAEAALLDGDVATAIAEVEALQGAEAERFGGWLEAAKAAEAARIDIDAIEQAAIAAADGA